VNTHYGYSAVQGGRPFDTTRVQLTWWGLTLGDDVENHMIVPALRTVIADDEHLARKKLRMLLESELGVQVVAECQDGRQTVDAVKAHKPDLLFIDIRMPDLDGFQVLQTIPPDEMPVVVFTTAYDQFAIRAFEAHALDYLLKPFEAERLHHSIERVRAELL
jgi:two-component system LytT family response regulator